MDDLDRELKNIIENEQWTSHTKHSEANALLIIAEWLRDETLQAFYAESEESGLFVQRREDGTYSLRNRKGPRGSFSILTNSDPRQP